MDYFNPPDNIDFLFISRTIAFDFKSHDVKIFYSFFMTLPFRLRKPPDIDAFNYDLDTKVKRVEFFIYDLLRIELDSFSLI